MSLEITLAKTHISSSKLSFPPMKRECQKILSPKKKINSELHARTERSRSMTIEKQ